MTVNIKLFLTWLKLLFHFFKAGIKLFSCFFINLIGAALKVEPFSSVKTSLCQFLYQHSRRVEIFFDANIVFLTALKPTGNVIIRVAKDYNDIVAHLFRFRKLIL